MTPRFALWAFVAWLAITLMWWALAFAPLPLPAEWLAAARSVCFGTLPNGLPEPWGWATLVASPLAMLGFLLAVWGGELRHALRRLAGGRLGRLALAMLLAVPLLGAAWVGARVAQARRVDAAWQAATVPELYPRRAEAAPALDLVDQRGEVVSLDDLLGRPVLLTFAFAHCQTVCPVVVDTVKQAAGEVAELEPAVVVVTLDPWRDTPSSLPSLAAAWRLDALPRAFVLSGEVPQVLGVLDAWEMPHERDPQTGDVAHPALVHVLGPDGAIGYTFNGPSVEWVAEAVRRLTVEASTTL
jgi:cytochrome oxidase Cu insertion factor (SCO1/SenC/PrrC family)